jgi:hypothetical protein
MQSILDLIRHGKLTYRKLNASGLPALIMALSISFCMILFALNIAGY